MSIAYKYACFQVFCIPTEEMKDPDEETPEESKPTKKTLTQNQIKRLYALAHKANIDNDTVVEQVKKKFGCMPCELTKQQYDVVCAGYEKVGNQNG